jgi:hypothetical protein
VAKAYNETITTLNGLYQRFQYGFGGQIEIVMTLLEKQHWQAAADIMPLVQKEKVSFEALLLELVSSYSDKMVAVDDTAPAEEDGFYEPGTNPGEAPAS